MLTTPNEIDYGLVHDLTYCGNRDAYEARVTLHLDGQTKGPWPTYYVNVAAVGSDADIRLQLVLKAARHHRVLETWVNDTSQAA